MGGGSSKRATAPTGVWFTQKPIYDRDLPIIQAGIATGQYVQTGIMDIPDGWELWFTLWSAGPTIDPKHYARKMSGFKSWWHTHRADVITQAAAAASVTGAVANKIACIVLPVLLDAGRDAARATIARELPANVHPIANKVLDALAARVPGGNNGDYQVMKTGAGESFDPYMYEGAAQRVGTRDRTGGFDAGSDNIFTGACDCRGYIGAAEMDLTTIKEYTDSVNSKAKTQIVDDILAAASGLGIAITGATQQEKVKSMISLLPDGNRIKTDPEVQAKVCKGIALAINNAFGNQLVNAEMSPAIICQQVAEIVSSLMAGVHTEFLIVHNDVRKVLKNLHVLKAALVDDHDAIMLKIKASDDTLLPKQVATLTDLHTMLTTEIDRQIQVLSNLLSISLLPSEKNLEALIKSKEGISGYVDKIDLSAGDARFSKVIADILKGLGITANFTLVIEKALATVGMTIDEYAKGESLQKLREKVASGLMGKSLDSEQLHAYLEAAELLYKNFYRNRDIGAAVAKTGQYEMDDYTGGADYYAKTTMDKRVLDQKRVKSLIFTTFYKQINALFDQLVNSIDIVTMKVGTEIPLSDQLDAFRQVLQHINEELVRNKGIYYALIGYYNDAMSRSKKDALVGNLNMVSAYVETIIEMPMYAASKAHFLAIQGHIKAIITLIDRFTDEINAKFGSGGDSPECMYLEKRGDTDGVKVGSHEGGSEYGSDYGSEYYGSYDFPDAVYGGDLEAEPTIVYKSTKSIHDAVRQFDYKYRVAQIRSNMAAVGKELSHYSEKYEHLVANSIADVLAADKKVYEQLHSHLMDPAHFLTNDKYNVPTATHMETANEVGQQREAARAFLESQWESKKKFWATVEAVDTYMRVFTDALIKNPQDIKEIKSMLDSVEVINDWYSDSTGEQLSGIFDYFPAFANGAGLTTDTTTNAAAQELVYPPESYRTGASHYYEKVQTALERPTGSTVLATAADVNRASIPGNPYLVTMPTLGVAARDQAKRALSGLGVLKNLLSVFVHVGAKFGGEEIRKKVFMTPAQMYNNLVDYLQSSAFTQGFGVGSDLGGGTTLPRTFFDSTNMAVEINMRTGEFISGSTFPAATAYSDPQTYAEYNPTIVHLGVTAKQDVSVTNEDPESDIAEALVKKINAPLGTFNAGIVKPARDAKVFPLTWGSTLANADRLTLFKKRWGIWMRSTLDGLRQQEGFSFKREDEYFVLILKSLAAKILTVVGMYDVFDRPMEYNGLSPIRMITGGASETPKVEEEAVALYLRLPLLAQFYRNIFGFGTGDEDEGNKFEDIADPEKWRMNPINKSIKISMVPEVEGTFSGLVQLIFRKNQFVDGSNYSDDDIRELVREVNTIYQRMKAKYPQDTVMQTIHEFVAEINRRYGIVSKNERDQYEREAGYRYNYANPGRDTLNPADRYTTMPETEIAILPGEGDDEVVRPSAAERLLGDTFESREKQHRFTVSEQHKKLVYRFRCAIDRFFENPEEQYTFNHVIKTTQIKLRREQSDEIRFKHVATLVRGVDTFSKVDSMKHVLFHETVVGGLNILSAVHSMLARFKKRAHIISIGDVENQIWEWLMKPGTKTMSVGDSLVKHLVNHFTSTVGLGEDKDGQITDLVSKLLGWDEAHVVNGGQSADGVWMLKATDGVKGDVDRDVKITCDVKTAGTAVHSSFNGYPDGHHLLHMGTVVSDPRGNSTSDPGFLSVISGYSVEELRAAYRAPETAQNAKAKLSAETLMRFIFGREYVMKELIETLFGLGNDFQGLVTIKFEDGKLLANTGGLKKLIEEMFQHVSYFMDLLRPHVSIDVMARYTDKLIPGSYYWLQEQIMEKIIIGRPAHQAPDGHRIESYLSIDQLMQRLSYTFNHLTRMWSVNGAGLKSAAGPPSEYHKAQSRSSYDKVFAEAIFYDASRAASGLIKSMQAPNAAADKATDGLAVVDYLHDPYDALHFAGPAGSKLIDTRYITRFHQLYTWKEEYTFNRSALFSFNQLIAKYIQAFYDPVGGKIYNGLINQFANGAFSRSVADQLFTYPDTAPCVFVKFVAGSDSKVPATRALGINLTPADRADVALATRLFKQYLEVGINPTDRKDKNRLMRLLDVTKGDISGLAGTKLAIAAGGVNNTPKIYVYLLAHMISANILDIFNGISSAADATFAAGGADPLITAGTLALMNVAATTDAVAATAVTTFGAACSVYTGDINKRPTLITDITDKMLSGAFEDIIARVNAAVTDHSQPYSINRPTSFVTPEGASPMGALFGAPSRGGGAVAVNAIVANLETKGYMDLLNRVFRLPSGLSLTFTNYGSIVDDAFRAFPLRDVALPPSADNIRYGSELLAATLINMGKIHRTYQDPISAAAIAAYTANITTSPAAALAAAVAVADPPLANNRPLMARDLDTLRTALVTPRSTYAPGVLVTPKYSVKQDDIINTDASHIDNTYIQESAKDTTYLVLARDDKVDGAFEAGSITNLGLVGNGKQTTGADSLGGIQQFGRRYDPDGDHVLFTSLSIILRNLMGSKQTSNQAPVYLQENIADIALYMKEKMRANLPAFRNLFKELMNRCEFLKQVMGRPEVNLAREWPSTKPDHNPWPYVLQEPTVDSDSTRNRFTGILDSIVRGCMALVTSCEQVLREVGDDPKYLEVNQNSIKDYRAQYNVDPFMPLSSTLATLKNITPTSQLDFFPIHSLGEDPFKLMYGTRSLINQPTAEPLGDHVVGFTQIVDSFNLTIDTKLQADKARADGFMKTFVRLLRYVHELKHVKSLLTPYLFVPNAGNRYANAIGFERLCIDGMFARDDLVVGRNARGTSTARGVAATPTYGIYGAATLAVGGTTYDTAGVVVLTNRSDVSLVDDGDAAARSKLSKRLTYAAPAYAVSKSITDTIKLTESSFRDDKIKELVKHYTLDHKPRASMEVQNIVDLNIVPINVHALMREIPLVNLYNYAYTFDRLIVELYYGMQNESARRLIREMCNPGTRGKINSAKDALVAMLLDPYMNVFDGDSTTPRLYDTHVKAMMLGNANTGELGRPKFLSDQIFNKAVFGEVYASQTEYTERGPGAPRRFTEQDGINLVTDTVTRVIITIDSATKFKDLLLSAVGKTPDKLRPFINAIVTHVAQNPSIRAELLYNQIQAKFLSLAGPGVFASLQANPDGALAIMSALVVKMVYTPVATAINMLVAGADMTKTVLNCVATVQTLLAILDGIDKARPGGGGDPWLGFRAENDDTKALAANEAEAMAYMVATLQKYATSGVTAFSPAVGLDATGVNGALWPTGWAGSIPEPWAGVINTVVRQIAMNPPWPAQTTQIGGGTASALITLPNLWTGSQLQATLQAVRPGLDTVRPAGAKVPSYGRLHWLDIGGNGPLITENVLEPVDDVANTLQTGPRGDNENVMDDRQVKSVDVTAINDILAQVGRLRFDTILIRNLVFIVNLYRSVRMKLQRDLVYSKAVILRAEPITRAQLTEFHGNQVDAGNRRLNYADSPMWARYTR